jgi:hypothetical protein
MGVWGHPSPLPRKSLNKVTQEWVFPHSCAIFSYFLQTTFCTFCIQGLWTQESWNYALPNRKLQSDIYWNINLQSQCFAFWVNGIDVIHISVLRSTRSAPYGGIHLQKLKAKSHTDSVTVII